MGSGAMIYVSSFLKIGQAFKLNRRVSQTHEQTNTRTDEHTNNVGIP
jgi:hypothetical protein